jgi:hypothetical protein
MRCQSRAIDRWACAWQADPLRDVEDDGCEAVFIEVDFLMVGDLTDCAEFRGLVWVYNDGDGGNTPDVGEGAWQVDDKSPTEEWRACERCHLLLRLAVSML